MGMYTESEAQKKLRENNFTYHAPKNDQADKMREIRNRANDFAYLLNTYCPVSRELSIAMTKLEECVMFTNASITRNE